MLRKVAKDGASARARARRDDDEEEGEGGGSNPSLETCNNECWEERESTAPPGPSLKQTNEQPNKRAGWRDFRLAKGLDGWMKHSSKGMQILVRLIY